MIVPQFWAEARVQQRILQDSQRRQITVRRFGWSNDSQADAHAMAEQRAQQALARLLVGETLARREPKIAYNGAHGVPIREEVIERTGETVITRNAYGALCLNTPDVLFADIDFAERPPLRYAMALFAVLLVVAVLIGVVLQSKLYAALAVIGAVALSSWLTGALFRAQLRLRGGAERIARQRVDAFVQRHPDWHLRLYRTPAGLRVLAMHRTFDPSEPAVAACFAQLGADPIYVRMCLHQRCFRARVSPKPWRIGISAHLRPRPGVWPINEEQMPLRRQWVAAYDAAAQRFAACRFVAAVGSAAVHPSAQAVQQQHDQLCRAASQLPLA